MIRKRSSAWFVVLVALGIVGQCFAAYDMPAAASPPSSFSPSRQNRTLVIIVPGNFRK